MKKLILLILLTLSNIISAQTYEEYKKYKKMFTSDTLRIEEKAKKAQDIAKYNDEAMNSVLALSKDYDDLITKYYNLLLSNSKYKKTKTDLENTQKNWLLFRENEAKYINALTIEKDMIDNQYGDTSDYGVIWGNMEKYQILHTNKQRLIELYNYLMIADDSAMYE